MAYLLFLKQIFLENILKDLIEVTMSSINSSSHNVSYFPKHIISIPKIVSPTTKLSFQRNCSKLNFLLYKGFDSIHQLSPDYRAKLAPIEEKLFRPPKKMPKKCVNPLITKNFVRSRMVIGCRDRFPK